MRDYSNMPELEWDGERSAMKAKAQISHQEPVILQMPAGVRYDIDARACGCELDEESGILVDCQPGETLTKIATDNQLDALGALAEAARVSGSRVDIDAAGQRIIIHD